MKNREQVKKKIERAFAVSLIGAGAFAFAGVAEPQLFGFVVGTPQLFGFVVGTLFGMSLLNAVSCAEEYGKHGFSDEW